MSDPRVVLRLTDVVKTFPGVVALNGVTFEVTAGEVHALVGENGAGKSTLMAVAAGSTLPDSGRVEIGGRPMEQPSPVAAQALGLAVVYQQLSILEDLTVAENMVFAMPAGRRPPMGRAASWARERLAVVGSRIDPAARVTELSTADRQLLEIAKALALESAVLVLDEPTESLTRIESDRLFAADPRDLRDGHGCRLHLAPAPGGERDRGPHHRSPRRRDPGDVPGRRGLRGRDPAPDHRPGRRAGVPREAGREGVGARPCSKSTR